jgi:polysaccharide biosynthesis protein PslG
MSRSRSFHSARRIGGLSAAVCAAALLLATSLPAAAQGTTPPAPAPRAAFAYGTILNALDDAPLTRTAGFNVMSAYVAWSATEPSRGQYVFEQHDQWGQTSANDLTNVVNAARASNLKVGLRLDSPPAWAGSAVCSLDPADVEDYVYHVVKYAAGSLAYVEVFNEMNLPIEWGTTPVDPAAYARILAGAYRGAKRADPSVTVVSAAPSQRTGGLGGTMEDVDWLTGLYAAGGASSFDALGMHAYLGNFDPSTDPTCSPLCFRDVELYRAVMVQHGDSAKPALITEMGSLEQTSVDLGQYAWMELPANQRADYLVTALHMASTEYPWLLGATIFNLDYAATYNLPNTSERYWFSLLNPDHSPRLAYTRIQQARASGYLPD